MKQQAHLATHITSVYLTKNPYLLRFSRHTNASPAPQALCIPQAGQGHHEPVDI